MARVFGVKLGVLTLFCDAAKAAAALAFGSFAAGDMGLFIAGSTCIAGHCFPLCYGFRGGKGVSVGAAIAFAIDWRVGLSCVGVFLLSVLMSRKISLGSISAAAVLFVSAAAFQVSPPKLLLALFAAALVINRHAENMERLHNGTEPDVRFRRNRI